jgi:hypothetical protein
MEGSLTENHCKMASANDPHFVIAERSAKHQNPQREVMEMIVATD